jgi:predicted dehydrogenase
MSNNITRRDFVKQSSMAGLAMAMPAYNYRRIIGSNDRIRVGCVGFSDRFKHSLFPPFQNLQKSMNFEMTALSDIWNLRRDEGGKFFDKELSNKVAIFRNNDELYNSKSVDAVFISTADFQHAVHTIEAVKAGCDVYAEKPLAETMEDNRNLLKAVKESNQIFSVGSQRRSGSNYHQAKDFIQSGEFGPIVMVELFWNVNQPGRWRRPDLVKNLKENDVDWTRFQINRPKAAFDPRKYLEYRLFWPYSSGIPGQWMAHQIDTVHWFSGLQYPRSVVANGGIYQWKDGRTNADTMAVTFDYGPINDKSQGFQVVYLSRFSNSAGGVKELYYSNGGMINLDTNEITDTGGMRAQEANAMGFQENLLKGRKLIGNSASSDAVMNNDPMTFAHVKNWMECVRDRKETNASIEVGYSQSIATIMANAAYRTGQRVVFDVKRQEVLAGGKVFKY